MNDAEIAQKVVIDLRLGSGILWYALGKGSKKKKVGIFQLFGRPPLPPEKLEKFAISFFFFT